MTHEPEILGNCDEAVILGCDCGWREPNGVSWIDHLPADTLDSLTAERDELRRQLDELSEAYGVAVYSTDVGTLDEAWRGVEQVVAETFRVAPSMGVSLRHGEEGAYYAWAESIDGRASFEATGPTPTAALEALCAALSEGGSK